MFHNVYNNSFRVQSQGARSPARQRVIIGITGAASLLVSGLAITPAAHAASAAGVSAPIPCPSAFPTNSAVDGVQGTGFTVERGTHPDAFTATILGRVTDGIAPGIDMIMADLDSPALQRAGGVWAGMSGSPVYTDDGQLIGSVSYGLSYGPSRIAGLTPAEPMKALLNQAAAAKDGTSSLLKTKVTVPAVAAKRIAATGEANLAQASQGFQSLTLPLWVSGATSVKAAAFLNRLQDKIPGTRVMGGGSAAPLAMGKSSDITAGGNFAATISYGDATLGAVGTTTFVCKKEAVAFGHPFLDTATATLTAHAASAVYVQPDPAYRPFKVANITAPAGHVFGDYTTGIVTRLGRLPATTEITSSLAKPGGSAIAGTTRASYAPYTPDAAAFHTYYNVQRVLNADPAGSAAITITVQGLRGDGSAFTVTRTDRHSSTYSIAGTVANEVYWMLGDLLNQPYEKIQLTKVKVTGTVDTTPRQYRVTALKLKQGEAFVDVPNPIPASAGSTLTLRATLTPYQGVGATRTATVTLPVAAGTAGTSGTLEIISGSAVALPAVTSFEELLERWHAGGLLARMVGTLYLDAAAPATETAVTDGPVDWYSAYYAVNVG
jgi:hypothetical protein